MSRRINISEQQLSLPFRERGARAISYETRQRFFWFLAGVSFLSLVLYFYAIEAMARNVALRENLEARVTEASGALGSLEFSYIALKNNVSFELAQVYGFKEAEDPIYVSRNQQSALTLNTDTR